ncbi:hypothetical protein HPB50_027607 [Hyalomma asiaticum]|nr:hypothetical protein HPB50_027607 [Hyalomma asiaticum]
MALGVHGFTPNEAVQGDLGWSSFKAREAVAKLTYERRFSGLPDGRWERESYKYVHLKSMRTRWVARTRWLAERYRVEAVRLTEPLRRDTRQKVREVVRGGGDREMEGSKQGKKCPGGLQRMQGYHRQGMDLRQLQRERTAVRGPEWCAEDALTACQIHGGAGHNVPPVPRCRRDNSACRSRVRGLTSRCALWRKVRRTAAGSSCDDALSIALGFRDAGEAPNWDAVDHATKQRLKHWWRRQARQAPR